MAGTKIDKLPHLSTPGESKRARRLGATTETSAANVPEKIHESGSSASEMACGIDSRPHWVSCPDRTALAEQKNGGAS
jgi:hypothetical protein